VDEEPEERHEINQFGRLEFGDHLLDELRDQLCDRGADSIDELRECKTSRVAHNALRLHRLQCLEQGFRHLLERRLVWQRLELFLADLREAFRKVAQG
jgi:hypothetical protein